VNVLSNGDVGELELKNNNGEVKKIDNLTGKEVEVVSKPYEISHDLVPAYMTVKDQKIIEDNIDTSYVVDGQYKIVNEYLHIQIGCYSINRHYGAVVNYNLVDDLAKGFAESWYNYCSLNGYLLKSFAGGKVSYAPLKIYKSKLEGCIVIKLGEYYIECMESYLHKNVVNIWNYQITGKLPNKKDDIVIVDNPTHLGYMSSTKVGESKDIGVKLALDVKNLISYQHKQVLDNLSCKCAICLDSEKLVEEEDSDDI
jgi:hypothetical protein